jgi:predicted CXXCH cytochrome family protein
MKWANKAAIFTFLLLGVFVELFFVGCSSEKQHSVLSFFFDGVPEPKKEPELVNPVTSADSVLVENKESKPDFYIHKPYEEEKCKSCHEEGFSNALIKPVPDLCYTCHEDFGNKYKTLHGPVASGNCTGCHNHHMSKYESILERPGQQLCLYCHESAQVLKNKMHEHIGEKNCTECHSPHGGENSGMLNSGSCLNCHENFSSKYSFLHGPVSSGSCSSCHDSHNSKSKKLLLRDSQQLCLFCHNAEQIFNNATHKKNRKNNCTECHNPHGGEDRFFQKSMLKEDHIIKTDTTTKDKQMNNPETDSLLIKQNHQ